MFQAPDPLITDRLILRRPSLSDAAAILEYASDPEVTRYMTWQTHTDIQDTVEFLESSTQRWKSGEEFGWVITIKAEDQVIGAVGCRIKGYMADFGYVLNRNFWGRGYATEAANAVVSWVMSLPEIYRVWATCDTKNFASARVLEKVGLSCEGKLRYSMIRPNLSPIPRDTFIFAKIRDET